MVVSTSQTIESGALMYACSGLFTKEAIIRTAYLEVVRQLGASGVARVHGDEHAARVAQGELGALEFKRLEVRRLGALDRQDLLRNNTQHLQGQAAAI